MSRQHDCKKKIIGKIMKYCETYGGYIKCIIPSYSNYYFLEKKEIKNAHVL